jgi:hypothetical protein
VHELNAAIRDEDRSKPRDHGEEPQSGFAIDQSRPGVPAHDAVLDQTSRLLELLYRGLGVTAKDAIGRKRGSCAIEQLLQDTSRG